MIKVFWFGALIGAGALILVGGLFEQGTLWYRDGYEAARQECDFMLGEDVIKQTCFPGADSECP